MKCLVGANIPVTKLLQGAETDYLLQYDDHSYYWQFMSMSYFFHKHWGLELNFQAGTSSKIKHRADNFITDVQAKYDDKYYVHPTTGAEYDDDEFYLFLGDISRGYLGLIYRFETKKFYVYPKFAIGVISFSTDWGSADLKEKNSNIECKINYSSKKIPNDHFTIAPSVSFGYKILNRLYLNADIMFSHYKTNIVFKKETTNLYTNKSSMEYFDYKKSISTLSLGTGLIYIIH